MDGAQLRMHGTANCTFKRQGAQFDSGSYAYHDPVLRDSSSFRPGRCSGIRPCLCSVLLGAGTGISSSPRSAGGAHCQARAARACLGLAWARSGPSQPGLANRAKPAVIVSSHWHSRQRAKLEDNPTTVILVQAALAARCLEIDGPQAQMARARAVRARARTVRACVRARVRRACDSEPERAAPCVPAFRRTQGLRLGVSGGCVRPSLGLCFESRADYFFSPVF